MVTSCFLAISPLAIGSTQSCHDHDHLCGEQSTVTAIILRPQSSPVSAAKKQHQKQSQTMGREGKGIIAK